MSKSLWNNPNYWHVGWRTSVDFDAESGDEYIGGTQELIPGPYCPKPATNTLDLAEAGTYISLLEAKLNAMCRAWRRAVSESSILSLVMMHEQAELAQQLLDKDPWTMVREEKIALEKEQQGGTVS